MYIYIYMYICICIYVYMYICIYVYMYMYMYMYTGYPLGTPNLSCNPTALRRRRKESGSGQLSLEELIEGARKDPEFQSRLRAPSAASKNGDE